MRIKSIQAYEHKHFFYEIPNLENKILLDLGAGYECTYSLTYLRAIYEKISQNNDKKTASDETKKCKKNIIALDLKFKNGRCSINSEKPVCADVRNLPFDNEKFDIITMGWLLDYFRNNNSELEQTIKESVRVMKPNSYLIGDALLHPKRSLNEDWIIHKLLMALPGYHKQMKRYRRVMEGQGLKFIRKGLGTDMNKYESITKPGGYLAFFFIAQKQ